MFSCGDDGLLCTWLVCELSEEVRRAPATASGWKRAFSPSESAVPWLTDVRTGDVISPDDIEIDRGLVVAETSFGVVHRAFWRGTEVAVHELSLETFSKAEVAEFTQRLEGNVVTHPRMCQLYCYSLLGSKLQMVTSVVSNPLRDRLKDRSLRYRLRMRAAEQVARFLCFLHSCDPPLLHLNLTTDAVKLDANFNVRVDGLYGLERIRNLHIPPSSRSMWRSLRVMPPELLVEHPEPATPAADVWQFGMLLWSIQEQEEPYRGIDSLAALRAKVCARPPALPEMSASCPADLAEWIVRCLNPGER